MNQRRKELLAKTTAEKARLAAGLTTEQAAQPATAICYSKHFMTELQFPEDGAEGEEYAVYRVTDLLTTTANEGTAEATPEPVHVFAFAADAAAFVLIADALVDRQLGADSEDEGVPERLRGVAVLAPVSVAPVASATGEAVKQ